MMTIEQQADLRIDLLDRVLTNDVLDVLFAAGDFSVRHTAVFRPLFRASRLLPAPNHTVSA